MQTLQQLKAGQLNGCKRLQLAEDLTEFPSEIFDLADTLEVLDLSNNRLTSLPDNLAQLHQLKILFLSNNCFDHLPTAIANCPLLEMIGFKANRIVDVAENALPVRTRWLILTDNLITQLPHSMGQLYRLQKLALAGNHLVELPASMADCQSLELIRLSANRLTTLPKWLLQLPKLAWLAFAGNPFCQAASNDEHNMLKVESKNIALSERLGEGASGIIYRGRWNKRPNSLQDSHDDIAVKIFKGEVTSDGYPQDELNCCLTAGEHPNLIKVIARIDEQDQLGMVMELIPSRYHNLGLPPSLSSCTRDTFEDDSRLCPTTIVKIASQMADTLSHLHDNGISHGDIYAHNIMVDEQTSVLFGDFGAASNLSTLSLTQRRAMAAIEMRAFGCLLDDLLSLDSNHLKSTLTRDLTAIKIAAMQEDTVSRPSFKIVSDQLAELLLNGENV